MGTVTTELVSKLRENPDPIQRLSEVTSLIDEVRTELLPELAHVRRASADEARRALILAGMKATDATRNLANRVGASPQTIGRLVQEHQAYRVHDREEVNVGGATGTTGEGV